MRRLALLALVALAAFPLSAHGRWYRPRRVVVVEAPCRPYRTWEDERWEHRNRDGYYRRYDCDDRDDRVYVRPLPRPLPRPLTPPFQGRVELWFR